MVAIDMNDHLAEMCDLRAGVALRHERLSTSDSSRTVRPLDARSRPSPFQSIATAPLVRAARWRRFAGAGARQSHSDSPCRGALPGATGLSCDTRLRAHPSGRGPEP